MYLQRNYMALAQRYLDSFPVLCLIGPRQAGKTSFAKHLKQDWQYFDLEKPTDFDLISKSPELFFEQFPGRVIIDEAQEYPQLFKVLRGVIDSDREQKGRFIITGSSSPETTAHLSDSLAGRVGIIQVGTFKANEYYQTPLSQFYEIFSKPFTKATIDLKPPTLTNAQMRHCWMYGGYPEPLLANSATFYQDWMDNYYATYINRDIAKLFPRLNKTAYARFISVLSALSGTIINKSDLARAIEIEVKSVSEYLQIAEQTYIWRNIPYDALSKVKSIVKKPKGLLTDSGLQHYLQKIQSTEQLISHPSSGRSFESFVIEELIKGITAFGAHNINYHYYRTAKGSEVDLIVTSPFGKIPIEIKMAKSVPMKQLITLNNYIEENNLPFGLLINQSDRIFWVTDKILQVPVGIL